MQQAYDRNQRSQPIADDVAVFLCQRLVACRAAVKICRIKHRRMLHPARDKALADFHHDGVQQRRADHG